MPALLQRQNVVNSLQLNENRFGLNLHLTQLHNQSINQSIKI